MATLATTTTITTGETTNMADHLDHATTTMAAGEDSLREEAVVEVEAGAEDNSP